MKKTQLALLAAVVLVGVVAGYVVRGGVRAPAPQAEAAPAPTLPSLAQVAGGSDPAAVYRVPLEDVPVRGKADALVTVVEVSDFECPFCRRARPTLEALRDAYGDRIRFAFRHNPISGHPAAVPAAMAAEAARATGGDARFWKVADALFALDPIDRAGIERVAREAGVPEADVKAAIDRNLHVERVRRDQNFATRLGAQGTPTFFVNGRKIVGAWPLEVFRAVVDEELAKAERLVRGGVSPRDVYARTIEKGAEAPVPMKGTPPVAAAARVSVRADDPVRGPGGAPVTLVLFSDFQCPFCARIEPSLAALQKAYPAELRVVWKHQPLPFHPNALPAAKAAEAARAAGKFWEMHDRLFSNPAALSEAAYAGYAKELGLDEAAFRRALASDAAAKRIAEDQALAEQVGATGTPTYFINCRRFVGAKPLDELKPFVEEELAKARAAKARGERLDTGWYDRVCEANVRTELATR